MLRVFTGVVFILALLPAMALAAPWPDYDTVYVNDFADVLDPADEEDLTRRLTDLRERHGVEMTVVTIQSMNDFDPADSWEAFATRLFNGWGIGNAERNDGVLFLFAMQDRTMRLEIGAGYHRDWNHQTDQIVQNIMVPNFKKGDPPGGIKAGVGTMIARITTNIANGKAATDSPYDTATASGIADLEQFRVAGDGGSSGGGVLDWIWYALIVPTLGGGAWAIRRFVRMRPRDCQRCETRMVLTDEISDDAHLDEGMQLEEQIKSVDYDVWICPSCAHAHIERWRNWFSRYGACPSCKYRALESDSTVLRSATYSSSGLKRIDYNCVNCQHHYSETKTIPRKTKSSSSSSSSSFGGGSSSGGGSSGSW